MLKIRFFLLATCIKYKETNKTTILFIVKVYLTKSILFLKLEQDLH